MDKIEKLEKAKDALQAKIDSLKAEKEKKNDEETELLLNSDSEAIEGGVKSENEMEDICGFFCVQGTF